MDEITNYRPVKPQSSSWDAVIERVLKVQDDGHASKLVRALKHGEEICKPYGDNPNFKIKGQMWENLGNMGRCSISYTILKNPCESLVWNTNYIHSDRFR